MQLKEFLKKADHIFLELCWCHWRRLGAHADGPVNICSTDPESLLLLTCVVGNKDERLLEIAQQWLSRYQSLIMIERLQRLLSRVRLQSPPLFHEMLLKELVEKSLSPEEKNRWETLLTNIDQVNQSQRGKIGLMQVVSQKKIEDHEMIVRKNLQMTLRQMFGPIAKADVLYLLQIILGDASHSFHAPISASLLARLLGFDRSSIYRVLSSLELTHVVEKRPSAARQNNNYDQGYSRGSNWFLDRLVSIPEKAYVDWFQIAGTIVSWSSFEKDLLVDGKETSCDAPFFKINLYKAIETFVQMAHLAFIQVPRVSFLGQPIEATSVDEMLESVLLILGTVLQYVSQKK